MFWPVEAVRRAPEVLGELCVSFCFFFSSRRRHTRCSRDWSSDVCSSDLIGGFLFGAIGRLPRPGDQVAVKGAVFEIVEVEGRRVGTVRVLRRGSGAEA